MIKSNLVILLITIIFTVLLKKYNIEEFKINEGITESIKNIGLVVKELNKESHLTFPFNLIIKEYNKIVNISNSDINCNVNNFIIKNEKYKIHYNYTYDSNSNNNYNLQLTGPVGNIYISPSEIILENNTSYINITEDNFEIKSSIVDINANQYNIQSNNINMNTNQLKILNEYYTHLSPGIIIPFKGGIIGRWDKQQIPPGWIVCNMKLFHLKSEYLDNFEGYEYQNNYFDYSKGLIYNRFNNSYQKITNFNDPLPKVILLNTYNSIFDNNTKTYEPTLELLSDININNIDIFHQLYMYVPDMTNLWGIYQNNRNDNDDNSYMKSAQAHCRVWDSAVYIIKY
jgi:hypothetical protein